MNAVSFLPQGILLLTTKLITESFHCSSDLLEEELQWEVRAKLQCQSYR